MEVGKPCSPNNSFVIHRFKTTVAVRNRKSIGKVAIIKRRLKGIV